MRPVNPLKNSLESASGPVIVDGIPVGLEILVRKAAVDEKFKERLMSEKAKAAAAIGLTLDPTERAIIDGIPEQQLRTLIAKVRIDPSERPAFMGSSLAAMAAVIAQLSLAPAVTGADPASPASTPTAAVETTVATESLRSELTKDSSPAVPASTTFASSPANLIERRHRAIAPGGIRPRDKVPLPPIKPLELKVLGIVGKPGDFSALIEFEGQTLTISKDMDVQKKFKVVEILPDKIVVYSMKEQMRRTFLLIPR